MEIRNIITFVRAAELQSFTKVAKHLGYSQAAVTVQIHQLEEELNTKLFDRIGRTVKLTDSGVKFLPYANELLRAFDEAKSYLQNEGEPSGILRIGANSSVSSGILPGVILEFTRRYPKVEIVVRTSDLFHVMMEQLHQNEIDFICSLDAEEEYQDCVIEADRVEEIVFTARSGHPLTRKDSVQLEEIFREQFVSSDRNVSYGSVLEHELTRRGIEFRPLIEIGSTSAIVNILRRGDGVSLLPRIMVEGESGLEILNVEDFRLQMRSQVIRNKSKWINPQMQAFMDFIREYFGSDPGKNPLEMPEIP